MSLRKNVIANYLGQGWTALMGLAFIPFYIATLGIEAWGLVGFMAMLQAWFLLLDMGLTPALSREMARFLGGEHSAQSIRNLLRSLEFVYGGIALAIIIAVWLSTDWVANNWLSASQVPLSTVQQALTVMGFVIAARMTEQVYRGAIQGLQRQVWLNSAQAVLSTLRWAGVVPVLLWIEASIQTFFLWQGLISIVSLVVFAKYTYHSLPASNKQARFSLEALHNIKAFAGGMAATTLLSLMLVQVDKVLLSKLVSLDEFGYYTLAASVAAALGFVAAPLVAAVFPRMTESVARSDQAAVLVIYHSASQWLAVVLIPVSLVMTAFSEPLIFAWTGSAEIAARTAPLLSLLALGFMCNGFMHIPYIAQLAHGWTGLAVRINIVAVCVIVPVIIWGVPKYGPIAAAWTWFILNVGYVLIGVHFMHRRIMRSEKWNWYRDAVFVPLIFTSAIVLLMRNLLEFERERIANAFLLTLVALVAFIITAGIVPASRIFLIKKIIFLSKKWKF